MDLSEVSWKVVKDLGADDVLALHGQIHARHVSAPTEALAAAVHGFVADRMHELGLALPENDDLAKASHHGHEDTYEAEEARRRRVDRLAEMAPAMKALEGPEDCGWDGTALAFRWFENGALSWVTAKDILGDLAGVDVVGPWHDHWHSYWTRKALLGEPLPADLPDWARPTGVMSEAELQSWQVGWAERASALSKAHVASSGGAHVLKAFAAFGINPEGPDPIGIIERAVWSTAYVNDLPDSAFLAIEPGGKKVDGKTMPRSLRHFPVYDDKGKPDIPHLRNALGRIPQSKISEPLQASALRRAQALARSSGEINVAKVAAMNLPDGTRFEIAKSGDRQIVTGPVLLPDRTDLQGDRMAAAAVEQVAHDFLTGYQQETRLGLQHKAFPPGLHLIESWTLKEPWTVGKRVFPEGTWMMSVHVQDSARWAEIRSGALTGFSIRGVGQGYSV